MKKEILSSLDRMWVWPVETLVVIGDFWWWGSFVVSWVGDFCLGRLLVGRVGVETFGGGWGSWGGVETFGGRGDSSRLSLTEQPTRGTLEQPTSGTLHPIPAHVQTLNIFVLTKEIYGEFVLDIFGHFITF